MLKFISLLGTNRYLPCNYYLDEDIAHDCCYIQKAIIEILINKGVSIDKAIIFTTSSSHDKNWIQNARDNARFGLKDELKKLSEENGFQVENVMIPEGHSEDEIWELFDIILNHLEENDEIILDITHSFRYLPMLTFIILNYARIVKKCILKRVYYGAFEVLGSYNQVEEMPLKERNAPIFDLTPFIDLYDWTLAIDRYLSTGDATLVKQLTSTNIRKLNEEINKIASEEAIIPAVLYKDSNALKQLSNAMKEFSDSVITCRGQDITKNISNLKNSIDIVIENETHEKIKPLSPIVEMLKDRFNRFSHEDEYKNFIETAKWCYDNGMYQQGLTILEEGIISYICDKLELSKLDLEIRESITKKARGVIKEQLYADNILGMSQNDATDLFKMLYDLGKIRNDINHAGWRENYAKSSVFRSKLNEFIEKAESLILNTEKKLGEIRMLLIFSHNLTEKQIIEAKDKFSISKFVELDNELLVKWSNVPPDLEDLNEYLKDIMDWIDENGRAGDYALVQGDFGATNIIVNYCKMRGIIPIYATTKRKAVEEKEGEQVKVIREFEHVMFRRYQ